RLRALRPPSPRGWSGDRDGADRPRGRRVLLDPARAGLGLRPGDRVFAELVRVGGLDLMAGGLAPQPTARRCLAALVGAPRDRGLLLDSSGPDAPSVPDPDEVELVFGFLRRAAA